MPLFNITSGMRLFSLSETTCTCKNCQLKPKNDLTDMYST